MEINELGPTTAKTIQEVLGYLNFSSGTADPRFLANLSHLFELVDRAPGREQPTWKALGRLLHEQIEQLAGKSDVFRHVEQAREVVTLVFEKLSAAYRQFHRDLLFQETDEALFQPFFIGRALEAVLRQGGPWQETDRITTGALAALNDYIGYRPVAVLRSRQKIQPYQHEWVRPIPLFIRGAGVAYGQYRELIQRALAILEATDSGLLFDAMFEVPMLDELAVDPRAYDFDHPINKRPNYLFGQWDLGTLDNAGRCRRFVLQQVSLEAIVDRVTNRGRIPYDEAMFEAAAVLAGTMLMGSGVSGNRPDAHDSSATLSTLVVRIAQYRDTFYEKLLATMQGPHAARLMAEAKSLQQPLGGARQHFNQYLARRRAEQLQQVHLAELFARMGHTEAAARQVRKVSVASARMRCDIHCRLTGAEQKIESVRGVSRQPAEAAGDPAATARQEAAGLMAEAEDLLHRAIECGAMVDPWNILGFGGQISLFPAPENSIHDHRIDELAGMMSDLFGAYVQIQKEAAAAGDVPLERALSARIECLADWWDQFASSEIGGIDSISGRETHQSADHVAAALRAWHEAGTAAGDIAFWRSHSEQFRSPKAYALVVDALLEQRDPVAAMALLVQWLSQSEEMPLIEEDYSFHDLLLDWMDDLWKPEPAGEGNARPVPDRWALSRKCLDYLEANANEYWDVPEFEFGLEGEGGDDGEGDEDDDLFDEEDESDGLFSAAYDNVSFRDSTDDGIESEMIEGAGLTGDEATDFELIYEAERIMTRLRFLDTMARLWKMMAMAADSEGVTAEDRAQVLSGCLERAVANRRHLGELLTTVYRYHIPPPRSTHESLMEYDRRRSVKETLLDEIIAACVETADAARIIRVVLDKAAPQTDRDTWEGPAERVLRGVLRGDVAAVRRTWKQFLDGLSRQPLLYVALARGGNPHRIVASRGLQHMLRRFLDYLPRLGLLTETRQLLEKIHAMEMAHPVGPGAITEFDHLFRIGCRAMVQCLVTSAQDWRATESGDTGDGELIAYMEQLIEGLLRPWLNHSRGVRLSVLESLSDKERWRRVKQFIEVYGHDIFTQRFLNPGNLRAILDEGVDTYLEALAEQPENDEQFKLLAALDKDVPADDAASWLTLIFEAVVENYSVYVDYNSTTTQSDRGEMFYTFLDFLRLKASYDRLAWNLLPVVLAHEVLVRDGRDEAAAIWQSAVSERTATIAEDHLKRFTRLSRKYGMRLPSIADRLDERFVRPLSVARLRGLVRPAIVQVGEMESDRAAEFARFEAEIVPFAREVSGAGFDVPNWLEALEQEVQWVHSGAEDDGLPEPALAIPRIRLTREQIRRQLRDAPGE